MQSHGVCLQPLNPQCFCNSEYAGDRCERCAAGLGDGDGDAATPCEPCAAGRAPKRITYNGVAWGAPTGELDPETGAPVLAEIPVLLERVVCADGDGGGERAEEDAAGGGSCEDDDVAVAAHEMAAAYGVTSCASAAAIGGCALLPGLGVFCPTTCRVAGCE